MLSFNSRPRAALTTLIAALSAVALSQTAPTDWNAYDYQTLQDSGRKVLVDKDGSIYVAAHGYSTSNGQDFLLVKYTEDSSHHLVKQWNVAYDGPGHGNDTVCGLALDAAGNIYVGGTSPGVGTGNDIAVYAWTPAGLPLWTSAARYNSGAANNDTASAMTIDANGNLIVVGTTTSSISNPLIVVFRPDGTLKWGQNYTDSQGTFNAVATDGTNIFAAGQSTSLAGNDMLIVRYNSGGSIISPVVNQDYQNHNDVATAITYTKNGRIAVAGSVGGNDGLNHMAVYAFDEGAGAPVWSSVYASSSDASAITYVDDYVYPTGTWHALPDQFLTEKIEWASGNLSPTWTSTGNGQGVRTLGSSLGGNIPNAIWEQGSNIYVSGAGNVGRSGTFPFGIYSDYLTVRYSKDGSTPLPFPSYFNAGVTERADAGNAVTDFCAGQTLVTGDLYQTSHEYDAGNLLYSQEINSWAPDSYTIDMGIWQSGDIYSLTYSDDNYLTIKRGYPMLLTDPPVSVTIPSSNINHSVSELCIEVESHGVVGVSQQVQVWNITTSEWQTLDFRPCPTTDQLLHLSVSDDPAHYIDGTGVVKARVRYFITGTTLQANWQVSIDQVLFRTTP